jgi:MFS transporter, SP family, galactose:H+ symporter
VLGKIERQGPKRSGKMATQRNDPKFCAAFAAALGGFVGGVQLALLSGLLELQDFSSAITHTTKEKSEVTVAYLLGSVLFALPAAPLCDKLGRRISLLSVAACSVVATTIMLWTSSTNVFAFGRLVAGAAFGLGNIVCPMYNSEIASTSQRGLFVNMYQLALTIGIFSSQILGAIAAATTFSFRVPLLLAQIPSFLMLAAVYKYVPESPAWLDSRGRHAEAAESRRSLAIPVSALPAAAEETGLLSAHEKPTALNEKGLMKVIDPETSINLLSLVTDASARRRLIIAAGVLTFQQLTGINNVIFYAPTMIIAMLGDNTSTSHMLPFLASAFIGFLNVIFTFVSLLVVERYGRRTLLLVCALIMFSGLLVLSMMATLALPAWFGVLAIMLFIIGFAVAWGPVPFLVSSEVFPVRYRGLGMTVSCLIMSFASLFVAGTFLELQEAFGSNVFIIYAALTALAGVFVFTVVPETRGLTPEEIDEQLS